DSKEDKLLLNAQSNAIYARGYLLFLRETSLMAQPFDAKGLKITADAFPIAEQVQSDSLSTQKAVFSASENGILAYQTAGGPSGTQLAWFDRTGKQTDAIKEVGAYSSPKLSANGQKLAVQITDPQTRNTDVWLHDLSRGLKTRFTFGPSLDGPAIWSPDGSRIAFASGHTARGIYQKASDISGKEELLVPSEDVGKIPTDWSSDGRFITYFCSDPKGKTKYDIWILPLFGDRKPFPFLQTEFNEMFASFSPDGKRIAYTSDESTKREIYVASFPGPGGKRQISTAGGQFPRWRRDGKELFYLSEDDKMMAAEVKTDGTAFEVGVVRPLFAAHPHRGLDLIYDVSADGQRFIINTYVSEQGGSPITLVTNWTAGLKR
ncbi:MAG TPA: hypothetical protein VGQ81_11335, partial [Acidobacteriota bacterium]|nr:hypothetical protein [Acidobacteriota bacterium]